MVTKNMFAELCSRTIIDVQFNVTADLADLYCESTYYLMLHTESIILDDSVQPALIGTADVDPHALHS